MKEADDSPAEKGSVSRKVIKPAALIIIGILIGFPVFSISYYTMVRTSTPQFCARCHELRPAVQSWRASTHANNASGVVADCMDCHLPAPQDTYDFFFAKTYHGIRDLIIHFTMDEYDRPKNRAKAYANSQNDQCLKCHRNLLYMPGNRGAMLAHRATLYARKGYEKKCIDCHYDLVHNDQTSVMFRQYRKGPYQAKGLRVDKLGI